VRRGADKACRRYYCSAGEEDGLDWIPVGEDSERKICQGDAEDDHRNRERGGSRVDTEFILDHRQHGLGDIDGGESRRDQGKDEYLYCYIRRCVHCE
jgi:hypothetical protein